MTLNDKYRPQDWDQFKGSEFTVSLLRTMVSQGNLPKCLLFSGSRGTGKTTAARILSKELNGGEIHDPLSYIEVDAASNNGVDSIRKLQDMIKYSHSGSWRIVVLDEAHMLTTQSFNALLKVLEEPPPNTVFVLVTTKPETLPDTVRSRSMQFRFSDVSVPEIALRVNEVCKKESIHIDPRTIVRIAEVSEGSLRSALVLLQQLTYVDNPTVEAVNYLTGNTVNTKELLYSMLKGELSGFQEDLSTAFHDTNDMNKMILNFIGTLKEFHDSGDITNLQFLSCMEILWNMRKVQESNSTVSRAQIEAGLYAMFAQLFWDGVSEEPVKKEEALTDEDLKALRK